jgi:nitroimidazol reductase NimA-like FMN-containing flavoprotein (pyridoxamine 5'-phosphate oxidase superfamily)
MTAVYEELSPDECLSLLGQGSIGRLAGVAEGRPFVFPINYALDGDTVVFRTSPGTKLAGAGFGRVAFEIDGVDEASRTGWSVIVQGVSREITDAVDLQSDALRRLDLQPWVPGERAHWVAIQAESITGRRLGR